MADAKPKPAKKIKPYKATKPCPKCGSLNRVYDAKWTVRVELLDVNGNKIRYNKAFSESKAEAVANEGKLKAGRYAGERVEGKKDIFSFEDACLFFESWLTSKVGDKGITEGTGRMYSSRLNFHLKPYFKGVDVRKLTETDVEKYRAFRFSSTPKPKPASINREIATLKRMTSLLYKRRMIPTDPLDGIEMLKEDNRREQVLTPQQIEAMLEECDRIAWSPRLQKEFRVYPEHLTLAVLIALNTGLRIDGVLTLKWQEVALVERIITKRVKGSKLVRVPMNQKLYDVLIAWRDSRQTVGVYVIPSPKFPDRPMLITGNFGFKRMCRTLGLDDFTFHQLRHQFVTYFIQHTRDISLCSKIVGHSTTTMTERYSHLIEEKAKAAMETFTI